MKSSKSDKDPIKFQIRSGNRHSKSNLMLLSVASIATVLGFLLICYSILVSDGNQRGSVRYSIVIDGGSTGTRIHVFGYRIESGKPVFEYGGANYVTLKLHRDGASVSLTELVELEVRLMATVGLRLLELPVQGNIFKSSAAVTPAAVAPAPRGQQALCYFVFGDSVFDNGNNNALNTIAKVNYLPYGVDFPQGPTGRFSNGRNIPDVIAELAGFNIYIPPFAGASLAQANIGLNYASGGGGIREDTSQNLGERISLREQVDNHRSAILRAAVPQKQLKQCLYTINIGSNDYLNNYFLPLSPTRRRYTPDQYAKSLILLFRINLKKLYILGARNVALFGIGKIGCTPRIVASFGGGTGCVEEVNQAADIFNNYLKDLVTDLNNNFFGAKFTYVDLFSRTAEDYAALGITVGDRSCCTVAAGEELCAASGPVCPDRTKYIFWDNVHTTEIVNAVVAKAAFNGVNTSPYSISQLVNYRLNQ